MPLYDLACPSCGILRDVLRTVDRRRDPCPTCGAAIEIVPALGKVVPDEIPGGLVQENGFRDPQRFYSWSSLHAALAAKGLEIRVKHVPVPGTDKSPHTTNWAAISPDTLTQAAALVARVTGGSADRPLTVTRRTKDGVIEETAVYDEPRVPLTVVDGPTFTFRVDS